MNSHQKGVELKAARRLAGELNKLDGTDYYAQNNSNDPPDCLLVSASGKFQQKEVEVTSIPECSEHAKREDNGNLARFERDLGKQLTPQITGYNIAYALTEKGLIRGVSQKQIEKLTKVAIESLTKDTSRNHLDLSPEVLDGLAPDVAEAVDWIIFARIPTEHRNTFRPVLNYWESAHPGWIENAIGNKAAKYAPREAARYDLVIVGTWQLGLEDIEVCARRNHKSPFRSIWVATVFDGMFRLQ
ncbi:MAG TPA: hypothetical protein VKS20_10475 [Candidatus Acidoferrales bacterium]|nr:hypothetical protein [Candidatus Acidoferrales bacterium]